MAEPGSLNDAERGVVWLLASLAWTAALAWVAFQVQQADVAPAVLFPLAVVAALGAGSGIALWPVARLAASRRRLGGGSRVGVAGCRWPRLHWPPAPCTTI